MKSLKHTSLKQAKIKAAALFAAVEDGKDPLANQQADAAADTFANLASRYLGAVGQEAAQSWRQTGQDRAECADVDPALSAGARVEEPEGLVAGGLDPEHQTLNLGVPDIVGLGLVRGRFSVLAAGLPSLGAWPWLGLTPEVTSGQGSA